MLKYHRLCLSEREEISRGLATGMSFRAIAQSLNRNVSTIANEVNQIYFGRNNYRATAAHKRIKGSTRGQILTFDKINLSC